MWLSLDENSPVSRRRQIFEQVKALVLRGDLHAGDLLPSSRELGRELGVARGTVLEAYEQLLAEGYLETRHGSGTRVACSVEAQQPPESDPTDEAAALRGAPAEEGRTVNFRSGIPALEHFPTEEWGRLYRQMCETLHTQDLRYNDPQGVWNLRKAIAGWLLRMRGLRVQPGQIMITTGATQGLRIVARLLHRPEALALVEDPVHTGLVEVVTRAGYEVRGIPVDEHGMETDVLDGLPAALAQRCVFIYLTPSHQYPTGGILPAGRRLAIIRFARRHDCMVVEDDYDGEFRFEGAPVSAMRELAPDRVVYLGSFSKILAPALRLGFAVIPQSLVSAWSIEKQYLDVHSDALTQRTLAAFINRGGLERHIWKMSKLYRQRRRCLLAALEQHFGSRVSISGHAAGLHLTVGFEGVEFRPEVLAVMQACGVQAVPVEHHSLCSGNAHGHELIMGYSHLSEAEILQGVKALHEALQMRSR